MHTPRATLAMLPLLLGGVLTKAPAVAAPAPEELSDLSGRAVAAVTLTSAPSLYNYLRYEVRVRNLTSQSFPADSVLVVLDKLTNRAGQEVDPLTRRPLLDQVEVIGQDGTTRAGKPYFRLPVDRELSPYAVSPPVVLQIRNPLLIAGLTPSFRILGASRPAPASTGAAPQGSGPPPDVSTSSKQGKTQEELDALVELLIEKGLLTREEWEATHSTPPTATP